jgi:glycosyltransferase involved in cell wall biosynthesis
MKVIFLMDQMYLHGGAERILSQKINYLIAHYNYEVHLITSEQRARKSVYELHPDLHLHDLQIDYEREKSYFSPQNLVKAVRHFWRLKRAIGAIMPDVVISVSYSPEQYFLPYLFKKIPKLKEFHSSRYNYAASAKVRKLERAFEKYHALVILNADELPFYPKHNTVVIPNFTTFESIAADTKQKTIIAAGRIAPVKQFDQLIDIWSRLANAYPDWQLKIFGDGDTGIKQALEQQIAEYNIQQNTHLLPATNAIREEMQHASLYAMTSATECFPMVLLEAQACGLPIISYDCPTGPRHIIGDGQNGILVAPDDQDAFVKQLEKLLIDSHLRVSMGENAQASVQHFSQQAVMQQWHRLIQNSVKNDI